MYFLYSDFFLLNYSRDEKWSNYFISKYKYNGLFRNSKMLACACKSKLSSVQASKEILHSKKLIILHYKSTVYCILSNNECFLWFTWIICNSMLIL